MKYRVEVAGHSFEVEPVTPRHVRIDGEDMLLDVVAGHVLHEGRSLRFHVQRDARGWPRGVLMEGHEIPLTMEDASARRAGRSRTSRASVSDGQVAAPMNGQVVKILRRAGELLKKGDVVLVLEAMKMENEVAAPVSGQLQAVLVEQGATVKPGDVLFTIDTATPDET